MKNHVLPNLTPDGTI